MKWVRLARSGVRWWRLPGGVDFGAEDGVEAVGGEAGEGGVVEGAGGVEDGGERVCGGDGGEECR